MHRYIICIGSNYNRFSNLLFARQELTKLFPTICFTREQETKPLMLKNPSPFLNQMGMFFSPTEELSVEKHLKEIEQRSGRMPSDKIKERVCLDIDLLACDNRILKPKDWERGYVKELLPLLPSL